MSPNVLEALIQSIRGLMNAAASTRGGVWTQNFLPTMEPVVTRLSSRDAIKATVEAMRAKASDTDGYDELVAAAKQRYLKALQSYVSSSSHDVAHMASAALSSGAELLALIGMISALPVEDDLRSFGRGIRALANQRALTPTQGQAIVRLRETLAADPTDLLARDRLFDLESR